VVNGWVLKGLEVIGLSVAGIALFSVPVAGLWLLVGLFLGRAQERKLREWKEDVDMPPGPGGPGGISGVQGVSGV
jgi:hypothetical protein